MALVFAPADNDVNLYFVGFGVVLAVLAALCFYGAWRAYGNMGLSISGAVGYPQFMKTREQLRKEIVDRDTTIERLEGEIAFLKEEHEASLPRRIDFISSLRFVTTLIASPTRDRTRHIRIYAIPRVHDSYSLAGQLHEILQGSFKSEFMPQGPPSNRHPLQSSGLWIVGDVNGKIEQLLTDFFREAGLFTNLVERDSNLVGVPDCIEIFVGDDGASLHGTQWDYKSGKQPPVRWERPEIRLPRLNT